MTRRHRDWLLIVLGALLMMLGGWLLLPQPAGAACQLTEAEAYNPSGWEGCAVYGDGIASRWPGPGVARNDCLWPWVGCAPITITARATGRTVTVTPSMFCDCYIGSDRARLVDLDPATVARLGLDWSAGLYDVTVLPAEQLLPDTALDR